MVRVVWSLLLLFAWSATLVAADPPIIIEVSNPGAHATALRMIEHPLDSLTGDFAVRGPDGKHLPAAYDAKATMLRFLAEVPAGGGKYTLAKGVRSTAKMPAWKKAKFDAEELALDKAKDAKRIKRVSGALENGRLKVSVLRTENVHGRIEIAALKGGYKLQLSPLGASVGCVETAELGKQADEVYRSGKRDFAELFSVFPSIATEAQVEEPNPLQRVLKVKCYEYTRKNNDEKLSLFETCGYDVTLTWNSPVVRIASTRKLKTGYFNHNGVNLNEIYIDTQPIGYANDGGESADIKLPAGVDVQTMDFDRAMLLRDKTGATAIMQPDFKKLAIYQPCVVLAKDRIMLVLSQSWHEGWKAIEIKAGDFNDTMTLACDVGASAKKLKDWEAELAPAAAPDSEKK